MRIEASRQINSRYQGDASSGDTRQGSVNHAFEQRLDEVNAESRALVATSASDDAAPVVHYRDAEFLAHLIATKVHAPQTRERRRADPSDAVAAYRAMAALAAV